MINEEFWAYFLTWNSQHIFVLEKNLPTLSQEKCSAPLWVILHFHISKFIDLYRRFHYVIKDSDSFEFFENLSSFTETLDTMEAEDSKFLSPWGRGGGRQIYLFVFNVLVKAI